MKKRLLPLLVSLTILSSCDSTTPEMKTTNAPVHSQPYPDGKHCYAFVSDKDSIFMGVQINDKNATGKLMYKLSEKDKNEGTFEGTMNADTLFATYHFSSEGMMSDREIIFILNDNKAVEAYGELVEENGKMKFSNPQQLSLDQTFALSKVNCNN